MVRTAVLLLVAQIDRLDSPDPATRVIARAIPALVVKHGQIVG